MPLNMKSITVNIGTITMAYKMKKVHFKLRSRGLDNKMQAPPASIPNQMKTAFPSLSNPPSRFPDSASHVNPVARGIANHASHRRIELFCPALGGTEMGSKNGILAP